MPFIDFLLPRKGHLKHCMGWNADRPGRHQDCKCVYCYSFKSKPWTVLQSDHKMAAFHTGTGFQQRYGLLWLFSLHGWRHQTRSGRPPSLYSFTRPSLLSLVSQEKRNKHLLTSAPSLLPPGFMRTPSWWCERVDENVSSQRIARACRTKEGPSLLVPNRATTWCPLAIFKKVLSFFFRNIFLKSKQRLKENFWLTWPHVDPTQSSYWPAFTFTRHVDSIHSNEYS